MTTPLTLSATPNSSFTIESFSPQDSYASAKNSLNTLSSNENSHYLSFIELANFSSQQRESITNRKKNVTKMAKWYLLEKKINSKANNVLVSNCTSIQSLNPIIEKLLAFPHHNQIQAVTKTWIATSNL